MNISLSQSWRPRDAWFFAGLTLLVSLLFGGAFIALAFAFPPFPEFLRSPFTQAALSVIGLFLILGVSLVFAKIKSRNDFVSAFDLTRPHEKEILIALAIGFLIQFVGIFIVSGDFSHLKLAHNFQPWMVAALLAPFFEEPAMRGFAYKAFRNSYSIAVSICFVVAIALVFHFGQTYRSLHGCLVIGALNVALCVLREKHLSLWSCIACHFVFNFVYVGIQH
jgi:membrane protease YdiL (CAAX protease family)